MINKRSSHFKTHSNWILARHDLNVTAIRLYHCVAVTPKFDTDLSAMAAILLDSLPSNIEIRNALKPGDIGWLIYLHGVLYAEECGWDHTFEAYVAGPLAEFAKSQTDRERIWIVEKDKQIAGSIAIVEAPNKQAQLRWLLLHPDLRGHGLGRLLVEEAIRFSKAKGYSSIFLLTVDALTAAAKIYQSVGFQVTEETTHELWGAVVTEQQYDLIL
jgi:N-acetylglutamate synthase-like GNAT family acetyltransferase